MITLVLISFWLICKCQCMCNKNCKDRCNGMTDQSHHSMASLSFTLTSRLTAESTNDHQDVWMGLQPVHGCVGHVWRMGGVGCLVYWLTMLGRPRGPEGDCQCARHPSEK